MAGAKANRVFSYDPVRAEADNIVRKIMAISTKDAERAADSDQALADLVLPILKGRSLKAFEYIYAKMQWGTKFSRERFWMIRRIRNARLHDLREIMTE